MNKYSLDYYKKIQSILKKIINKNISLAANMIKQSYLEGGQLYVFGTGHSHMMSEESFHRAGGFAELMLISIFLKKKQPGFLIKF